MGRLRDAGNALRGYAAAQDQRAGRTGQDRDGEQQRAEPRGQAPPRRLHLRLALAQHRFRSVLLRLCLCLVSLAGAAEEREESDEGVTTEVHLRSRWAARGRGDLWRKALLTMKTR